MPQVALPAGLTTGEAPFIEAARLQGELYIRQPYELYSEENHEAWRRLYSRMLPRWERYANRHFLQGINSLCLDPQRVPKLENVNRFLRPLTGFQAKAVSGYIPRTPSALCCCMNSRSKYQQFSGGHKRR